MSWTSSLVGVIDSVHIILSGRGLDWDVDELPIAIVDGNIVEAVEVVGELGVDGNVGHI